MQYVIWKKIKSQNSLLKNLKLFHWPQTALLLLCTQSELTRFWALETDWNADKSRSLAFYCWVWEIFSNNQTVCSYYIYLDVNGKLTQEIFYELHRIKDLSPVSNTILISTFLSLFLFFGLRLTKDVHFLLNQPVFFDWEKRWSRSATKRAPDLVWIGSYSLFGPLYSVSFFKLCLHSVTLRSQSCYALSCWTEQK